MPRAPRPLSERFWEKVFIIEEADACWPWKGRTMHIRGDNGEHFNARRVSYVLNVGEIPEGMRVSNLCDDKRCVRPNHLEAGKAAAKGSGHPRAKLTEWRVLALVDDLRKGMKGVAAAHKYGITASTVSAIVNRRIWRHVKFSPIQFEKKVREKKPRKRKLTDDQVREIRRKRDEGALVTSLAREYGFSDPSFISAICNFKKYKDVK